MVVVEGMSLSMTCPCVSSADPHHGEEAGSVTQVEELWAEDFWLHPPFQGW